MDIGFWVVSYFFPFSTLKMLFDCVIASIVSDENLAVTNIIIPLQLYFSFFLSVFKCFFTFGFVHFMTYLGVIFLYSSLLELHWVSWVCRLIIFNKLRCIWVIPLKNFFFISFSLSPLLFLNSNYTYIRSDIAHKLLSLSLLI